MHLRYVRTVVVQYTRLPRIIGGRAPWHVRTWVTSPDDSIPGTKVEMLVVSKARVAFVLAAVVCASIVRRSMTMARWHDIIRSYVLDGRKDVTCMYTVYPGYVPSCLLVVLIVCSLVQVLYIQTLLNQQHVHKTQHGCTLRIPHTLYSRACTLFRV